MISVLNAHERQPATPGDCALRAAMFVKRSWHLCRSPQIND